MLNSRINLVAVVAAILLSFAPPIHGDPCGMVPRNLRRKRPAH